MKEKLVTKVCNKCNVEKSISEFSKHKRHYKNKTYIFPRGVCKKCACEQSKLYHKKNKIKRKSYSKKYLKENREACKVRTKQWRKRNPDWVAEYAKNWIKNNPDKANMMDKRKRERLGGSYIKKLIVAECKIAKLPRKFITEEMVDQKRISILLRRYRLGKLTNEMKPILINLLQSQIEGKQNERINGSRIV